MKTPRDILLERHRAAETALDAIRRSVVAMAGDQPEKTSAISRPQPVSVAVIHWLTTPWRELILPSRRIWAGLATAWALIVVINVSQRDSLNSVTGRPVRSGPIMMSAQAQQRLMSELLAERSAPPDVEPPRNAVTKPRSQVREMFVL